MEMAYIRQGDKRQLKFEEIARQALKGLIAEALRSGVASSKASD